MTAKIQIPDLQVVIFKRDKWWIAQCLQYDIGAQAHTLDDVRYEIQRALIGHLYISIHHNKVPFVDLPPAPEAYWKKFRWTVLRIELVEAADFSMPGQLPPLKPEVRVNA